MKHSPSTIKKIKDAQGFLSMAQVKLLVAVRIEFGDLRVEDVRGTAPKLVVAYRSVRRAAKLLSEVAGSPREDQNELPF